MWEGTSLKPTIHRNRITFLGFSIIMIFILFISSYNKEIKVVQVNNDGMIVNSKLTDRELQLMRGTGAERFFIFDVNLTNKDINGVECWVDYFEKGEFKNKLVGVGTNVININDNTGTIMFSVQNNLVNETEEKLIISYTSKSGASTGSALVIKPKMIVSTDWVVNERNQIAKDKIINLAVIEKANNAIDTSHEIFKDTNSSIEKISKQNSIYILRCKFIHK